MADYCRTCEGRGILFDGENAVPCACVQERNLARRVENAQMPARLREQTFERFNLNYYSRRMKDDRGRSYYENAANALRVSRKFVESYLAGDSQDGLMFCGDVGTGKTFLACCIANAVLERGGEVLFLIVPDFLDRIRATYADRDDVSERDLVEQAKNVPLLVLDDLGAHTYSEWARQKIYSLLNYRLNHKLPVIVTTNLNLQELQELLGERTASRLIQMCRTVLLMAELDLRIVQRKEKVAYEE
ncbi:MAG: ATP-binding protein [Bacillota bacterium]